MAGGFTRVKLHAEPVLLEDPFVRNLQDLPTFEFVNLQPSSLLDACALEGLTERYLRLRQPAGQANVLRLALLATEGGVYLDTDTLTLRPVGPLLETDAFVGEEILIRPFQVARSRSWTRQGIKQCRSLVRKLCTVVPYGWELFSPLTPLYLRGVNNAVFGARPGAPLVTQMLQRILEVPDEDLLVRYRLGTHLLQETLAKNPELAIVHPPEVFYPLGPEISRHWFVEHGVSRLHRVITPNTRIVHWYASVKTDHIVRQVTPEYIRAHATRQFFSHLAEPFL